MQINDLKGELEALQQRRSQEEVLIQSLNFENQLMRTQIREPRTRYNVHTWHLYVAIYRDYMHMYIYLAAPKDLPNKETYYLILPHTTIRDSSESFPSVPYSELPLLSKTIHTFAKEEGPPEEFSLFLVTQNQKTDYLPFTRILARVAPNVTLFHRFLVHCMVVGEMDKWVEKTITLK